MFSNDRNGEIRARLITAAVIAVILILVGIGAIIFGLSKQAEYQRASYDRSREYTSGTYGPEYNACMRLPPVDQVACVAQANQKRRENTRGEADLVAQQIMSVWTFLMGGAAMAGMLLSAAGVILIYSTFQETKKTADAAWKSNDIARDVSRRQLRPYIAPLDNKVTVNMDGAVVREVVFSVVWKNFGQTPARQIKCAVSVQIGPEDKLVRPAVSYGDGLGSDIAPGQQAIVGDVEIPIERLSAAFHGVNKIDVLWGIRFIDLEGQQYEVNFAAEIIPQADPTMITATTSIPIKLSGHSFEVES